DQFDILASGKEHGNLRFEQIGDVFDGNAHHIVCAHGGGLLACHGVQSDGLQFALARQLRLRADSGRQRAQSHSDQEHDAKRYQVLSISYSKRKIWGHEEEVKYGHAQEGGENGWSPAVAQSDNHDSQLVNHRQIDGGKMVKKQTGYHRGESNDHGGVSI